MRLKDVFHILEVGMIPRAGDDDDPKIRLHRGTKDQAPPRTQRAGTTEGGPVDVRDIGGDEAKCSYLREALAKPSTLREALAERSTSREALAR